MEVDRVSVDAVVGELPDLGPVAQDRRERHHGIGDDLDRGRSEGIEGERLSPGLCRQLNADSGAHPTIFGVIGRAHFVMKRLRFERDGHRVSGEGLKSLGLLEDPRIGIMGEGAFVRGIVGISRDDDRILGRLEDTSLRARLGPDRLDRRKADLEGRREGFRYPDLHDRPGVRAVTGQRRRRAASARLVGVPRVVIITRIEGREGRGRVVVKDKRLAFETAKIDENVGPFRRAQEQREGIDVAEVEGRRIHIPVDRLAGYVYRSRQEAAFRSDLDKGGAYHGRVGDAALLPSFGQRAGNPGVTTAGTIRTSVLSKAPSAVGMAGSAL